MQTVNLTCTFQRVGRVPSSSSSMLNRLLGDGKRGGMARLSRMGLSTNAADHHRVFLKIVNQPESVEYRENTYTRAYLRTYAYVEMEDPAHPAGFGNGCSSSSSGLGVQLWSIKQSAICAFLACRRLGHPLMSPDRTATTHPWPGIATTYTPPNPD